uniref:Major sperm protein n=1 Tax=Globodera pallida TaxID=36090 RepID=A0A183BKK1_GLOPA
MLYNVEEDFDLGVSPKRAYFSSVTGGASRHLMVNGSSERMAIKVKCSNNRFFRISPVFTILDPGCAQRLQIVRDPGCPGMDKLVLMYTRTTGRNAREVFEQCDKSRLGRLLIALVARDRE